MATKVLSTMNVASKIAGARASSAFCMAATRSAPAWCGRSMRTPPGKRCRAASPTRRPWSKRSCRTLSGCSSGALGSCTSHHSFLWHWRPEVKRDLERRGGAGAMIKGSKEADPSLSRVRALAQDDSSARRVKKGKGGEVISFLCYAKRSEPVIPSLRSGRALSAAGAKDLLFQVLACPSGPVGINWKRSEERRVGKECRAG